MDNRGGMIGELLETGQTVAKKVGDQVGKTVSATGQQIAGQKQPGAAQQQTAAQQGGGGAVQVPQMDFAKDFLKVDSSQNTQQKSQQTQQAPSKPVQPQNPVIGQIFGTHELSQIDQAKLNATRERLKRLAQKEYFDETFNPQKPPEERPAEKLENEKKKEMMELQQKEQKKPEPIAVQRARRSTEIHRGAGG